jgi:hypothetical protein
LGYATGDRTDNDVVFGGGFHELAGSLSLVKRVDPLAFTGTFGYEAAFDDDRIDPGDTFFTSLGTVLAVSHGTSLRFVLDADFSDDTEVNGAAAQGRTRSWQASPSAAPLCWAAASSSAWRASFDSPTRPPISRSVQRCRSASVCRFSGST